MREIKKIFNVYYDKLGIKSNLIYGDESVIFGKTLMPEESTSFNFLYKGKNCQAIIEGKGENVKALIELLKATFSYSDSQTIKDKKDYVLKTLLGISGSKEYNQKYNLNYNSCVVMVISSKKSSKEICSFLPLYTNCLPVEIDKGLCAFIKEIGADTEDYLSLSKFAKIMLHAIEEEIGVNVKIGIGNPVETFLDINKSYSQANLALKYTDQTNKKVCSYLEVLPQKMLASLSEKEKNYFIKPFSKLLKNEELTSSAKEFLNSDLNINRASQNLFIHRNTLIYRLNKIERLVGLDLRNFNDAVTFKLLCLLKNLEGETHE